MALFERTGGGLVFRELLSTASTPVSVAFGNNHLYVLGTTRVESRRMCGSSVCAGADRVMTLLKATYEWGQCVCYDSPADEVRLVRNGTVLTTTPMRSFSGPVLHLPCWGCSDRGHRVVVTFIGLRG